MIYTVTLNPALDHTIAPGEERMEPGGKGLNVSKTLRAFGIPSVAATLSAKKRGRTLCRLAMEAGLTIRAFPAAGETRVNRKVFDGKQVTEYNQPGPPLDTEAFDALCAWLRQTLCPEDALALCGSLPPAAAADTYAVLCRAVGCRTIVDTSGEALGASLAARPWAVKPNLAELTQWAGTELLTADSRAAAMQAMCAAGAQRVLLSMGSAGAMLATDEGIWSANAPDVQVRGTVGAGDAMTAVLVSAPEAEPPALLRRCIAAGSAAAMQPGSAPPLSADLEALLPRISVQRLT